MEEKVLLSIREASLIFGIGQKRLRNIVAEDYGNLYHLKLGRTIKIKRKAFEAYIMSADEI